MHDNKLQKKWVDWHKKKNQFQKSNALQNKIHYFHGFPQFLN